MKTNKQKNKAQGMTEYMIILAVIAIASIGVVRTVGKNIQAGFGTVANALNGTPKEIQGDKWDKNKVKRRSLDDFSQGAQ
ncbi:MAG: hypothetical protein KDK51_05140 [Deltaproteobacteria bacterium]|nr:hypothetical protein [Deltaproteobacteria bacterium]